MLLALQQYLKYFSVFGLVPWSEKVLHQQLQKIYTTVIISLNIGAAYYKVIYMDTYKGDLFVSVMISCIVFITQTATMTVIELQVMFQYKKYYEFCTELKNLRRRFQCELQQPVKDLPWTGLMKIIMLGSISAISTAISVTVMHYNHFVGYFWFALGSKLVLRIQSLLLLLYIQILTYHVQLLGQRLRAVDTCRLLGAHYLLDVKCQRMCSVEYLLSLKSAYMELYRLYGHFNDLFGWSILGMFVEMFLDSLINIYWTLLIVVQVYDLWYTYLTATTFVPLLVILSVMCHSGEFCKRQHTLIGSHVRGLGCTSQGQDPPVHQAYSALLAEFAMQVNQDEFILSAEGFMDIDYNFLMSIFTAIVTYLIVLVQFGSL